MGRPARNIQPPLQRAGPNYEISRRPLTHCCRVGALRGQPPASVALHDCVAILRIREPHGPFPSLLCPTPYLHFQVMVQSLVFIGGGHAHVHALKMLGMDPIPGVQASRKYSPFERSSHVGGSGLAPFFFFFCRSAVLYVHVACCSFRKLSSRILAFLSLARLIAELVRASVYAAPRASCQWRHPWEDDSVPLIAEHAYNHHAKRPRVYPLLCDLGWF